eukprot:5122738-Pyramimonas_sp.AAC.2
MDQIHISKTTLLLMLERGDARRTPLALVEGVAQQRQREDSLGEDAAGGERVAVVRFGQRAQSDGAQRVAEGGEQHARVPRADEAAPHQAVHHLRAGGVSGDQRSARHRHRCTQQIKNKINEYMRGGSP